VRQDDTERQDEPFSRRHGKEQTVPRPPRYGEQRYPAMIKYSGRLGALLSASRILGARAELARSKILDRRRCRAKANRRTPVGRL
jgi:hypothetical protein